MERSIAVKRLSKLLGKGFSYEIDRNALTKEEKVAAKAEWKVAADEASRLEKLANERRRKVLAEDGEYQSLNDAWVKARKHSGNLSSKLHGHKFTVGHIINIGGLGGFFHVKASGDSWEEVIEKVLKDKTSFV